MKYSFRQAAVKILQQSRKPLHSKKITVLAMRKKFIATSGSTPWATMNAVIVVDLQKRKRNSVFMQTGPSTFSLNPKAIVEKEMKKSERNPLDEEFVKHSIVKYLSGKGWGHFEYGTLHVHGVDIRARKIGYGRYLSVETKGNSLLRQSDEVAFVYSLGQIATRMKDSGSTRNYYGLGLPDSAANIALRRLPWQVAKKLLLSVYSVNRAGEVEEFSWKELRKSQTK